MTLTSQQRFDNLDKAVQEGRIIRDKWTEGKDRVCLLAALSPEAGEKESPSACPANVIPQWLAHLTPSLDDYGSKKAWPEFVKRYAKVVRQGAEKLDEKGWRVVEYKVRLGIVKEAMSHTQNEAVLKVCNTVISLCERVVAGDEPSKEEWRAAWSAAEAARAAAWAAVGSAARAARAAAEAVVWSVAEAARAAAETAAWARAESAAESAAWDRIANIVLDAIEEESLRSIV